jgi:hypothetical protein
MENYTNIYGVDFNDKITPIMVRDAIIKCYYDADREVLEKLFEIQQFDSKEDETDTKLRHVIIFIRKIFNDVNADFENPTKESLIHVVEKCKECARMFREKEIIEKHTNEIMTLIDKLE